MKVLVVIDSLLPGGAERSLLAMLPGLSAQGVDLKLVCLKKGNRLSLEAEALQAGFPPHYLASQFSRGKWYRRLPAWVCELRRLVKREKPDLVHSSLFQAGIACRFALIGTGVPLLSSVVNLDYSPERYRDPNIKGGAAVTRVKLWAIKALNRWTRGLVSHFHAVTPAVKAETVKHLGVPPEQISVVFRGRHPACRYSAIQRSEIRTSLGFSTRTKIVLNVGRQEYQKGQIYLLRALVAEPLCRQDVHLIIAGREGNVTAELVKEAQRLNIQKRVHILGHRDDVHRLLAAVDVFVLPSLFEGAAGALLEAMAAEVPIVVSDLPELGDIIDGRSCLRIQPRAAEAISSAVGRLIREPELAAQFARRARKSFDENFLLEQVVAQMARLYASTAASGRSSPIKRNGTGLPFRQEP